MDSDRRSSAQRPEDERDHRLLTKERYLQPSHKTLYQAQEAEGKDGAREGLSLSELETVARDGIPGRGQVDIRVGLVERASVDTAWPEECTLARYVSLYVSDTGHGMPQDILERVFEPFFSTRETGTGLGLSTVFGIVRQLAGHIDIQSEEGKGTTVRVFLPPASSDSPGEPC